MLTPFSCVLGASATWPLKKSSNSASQISGQHYKNIYEMDGSNEGKVLIGSNMV